MLRDEYLGDWWRGQDLNLRPSGYEPDELPDCSTPRWVRTTLAASQRVFYLASASGTTTDTIKSWPTQVT